MLNFTPPDRAVPRLGRQQFFGAVVALCLTLLHLAPALGEPPLRQQFTAEQFIYEPLHKDRKDPRAALQNYRVIEDEDAASPKALSVRLDRTLIRQNNFEVLRTPSLGQLPVGTYRVTVRMKVQGMLGSLGSAVAIQAGNQTREVWMNEFAEEDVYAEFSLDFETREGDVVTFAHSGGHGYSIPRSRGGAVLKEAMPQVEEYARRNELPVNEQFILALSSRFNKPEGAAKAVETYLRAHPGQELEVNAEAGLTDELIQKVNNFGRLTSDGSVLIYFPVNTTGSMKASRGASTPLPTLRQVTIDWVRVEQLPEPSHLVLREVQPRYPWRRPGEQQHLHVWLHNRSGQTQTQVLSLQLETGLDGVTSIHEESVTLEPGRYALIDVPWTVPTDHPLWGQGVVAQIKQNGQVVSQERSYFAVHPYVNAVMVGGKSNTRRWLHPYAQPVQAWNHREYPGAGGTPFDSAGVVPDDDVFWEPYSGGNNNLWYSVGSYAAVATELWNQGAAPFFYLESHGSAQRAFEIYWEHPDWVPHMPANSDEFLLQRAADVERFRKWEAGEFDTPDRKPPSIARAGGAYSGQLLTLNGIVPENVDRVIQGILKLRSVAPVQGVRWDGVPFRAYNEKALGGSWGKSREELDAIGVANIRRAKQEIRAKYPDFEFAANGGLTELEQKQEDPRDFEKAWSILNADPLHAAFIEDHGQIMEEIWMAYAGFGSYTNVCRNYYRAAFFENSAFKRAGGHNNLMLWFYDAVSQYTPDEIYQQLLMVFAGAHLTSSFGPVPDSKHDFGVYAIRFSEFFWDTDLRPIPNQPEMIDADADQELWYSEVGWQKTTPEGNLLWVVPVINPPATERWLQNRFGMLPEPVREPVGFTVTLPDGYASVKSVHLLDNDPDPRAVPLEFELGRSDVYFELPSLVLFKTVVIEFTQ